MLCNSARHKKIVYMRVFNFSGGRTSAYMVLKFWKQKKYDLQIPSILGNCTLCFMKGKNAIIAILREFPELADPWIKDEELSKLKYGHTYFKGVTIKQLKSIAQNNLFKDYDLNKIQPAYNCSCTI